MLVGSRTHADLIQLFFYTNLEAIACRRFYIVVGSVNVDTTNRCNDSSGASAESFAHCSVFKAGFKIIDAYTALFSGHTHIFSEREDRVAGNAIEYRCTELWRNELATNHKHHVHHTNFVDVLMFLVIGP